MPPQGPQTSSLPWTASRCNRTLRQLTSFVNQLEKYWEDYTRKHHGKTTTKPSGSIKDATDNNQHPGTSLAARGRGPAGVKDDPTWMPTTGPSRPVRKYSRRTNKQSGRDATSDSKGPLFFPETPEAPKARPGGLAVATPFLRGDVDAIVEAQRASNGVVYAKRKPKEMTHPGAVGRTAIGSHPSRQGFNRLEIQPDSRYGELASKLTAIVKTFLGATSIQADVDQCGSKAPPKGASSLFLMCQRRLPSYIIAEQELYDQEKDGEFETEDACSEIFRELEDCYSPNGHGWSPLREICRAYGIRLLCDAIENGILQRHTALSNLLGPWGITSHVDAVEAIATSLLRISMPIWPSNELLMGVERLGSHDGYKMERLDFLHSRGIPNAQRFLLLVNLLKTDVLPAQWLAIDSFNLKEAVQSVCCGDDSSEAALELIKTFIFKAITRSPYTSWNGKVSVDSCNSNDSDVHPIVKSTPLAETLQKRTAAATELCSELAMIDMVRNLALTFCTAHLVRQQQFGLSGDGPQISFGLFKEICIESQQYFTSKDYSDLTSTQEQSLAYTWLTAFMMQWDSNDDNLNETFFKNFDSFICDAKWRDKLLSNLGSIVRGAAVRAGHALGDDPENEGFEILQRITESLPLLGRGGSLQLQVAFHRIGIEAAISFATLKPLEAHIDLLEGLQKALASTIAEAQVDVPDWIRGDLKATYRWEETLEEWVVQTPGGLVTALEQPVNESYFCDEEDEDDLSPSSPDPLESHLFSKRTPAPPTSERATSASPTLPTSKDRTPERQLSSFLSSLSPPVELEPAPKPKPKKRKRGKQAVEWQPYVDDKVNSDDKREDEDEDELSFIRIEQNVLRDKSNKGMGTGARGTKKVKVLQSPDGSEDELAF